MATHIEQMKINFGQNWWDYSFSNLVTKHEEQFVAGRNAARKWDGEFEEYERVHGQQFPLGTWEREAFIRGWVEGR